MQRHILAADADLAAAHAAVFDQTAGDELRGIDGEGETDALRRQNDGGVDTDDFAARSHQRPARIAGIERRVCLYDVVDQTPRTRRQRAAKSTDYTRRDR